MQIKLTGPLEVEPGATGKFSAMTLCEFDVKGGQIAGVKIGGPTMQYYIAMTSPGLAEDGSPIAPRLTKLTRYPGAARDTNPQWPFGAADKLTKAQAAIVAKYHGGGAVDEAEAEPEKEAPGGEPEASAESV